MTEPIKPSEINEGKSTGIPDFVIESINKLLIKRVNNGYAAILQDDLVLAIVNDNSHITRAQIFVNHWLDFEALYSGAGWNVVYNRNNTGYRESPFFTFTAKD